MTWHGKSAVRFIGSLFCCALLCALFLCASVSAADYPDVEGHWARSAIERWSDSGILKGYPDGSFGPNDPVTRAQLSEVLYRIWGCEPKSGHTFEDASPAAWYYESLITMNAYGIALGRDGLIRPDEPLSREEAFYMVAKAFQFGGDGDGTGEIEGISDGAAIDSAYFYRISALFQQKILKGASDGAFHPKDAVTRAEVISVIDNLFDVYISEPGQYTMAADQVALVACGGVTISYTPIPNYNYTNMGKVYLTAGAADGGVLFSASEFKTYISLMLEVWGVSEGGKPWTEEGIHSVSDKRLDLTDPKQVPDMRFAGGIGTKRSPYLIETAEQFLLLDGFPYTPNVPICFELQNDIELPEMQGSLDVSLMKADLNGNGHTLTYHMRGNAASAPLSPGEYGLFRVWYGSCTDLALAGTLDLTVDDGVKRQRIQVGGLAGRVSGTLVNCTTEMDMTVRYSGAEEKRIYVGGLAGTIGKGSLTGCTGAGRVSVLLSGDRADADAGGLVGVVSPASYTSDAINTPFPDTKPYAPPAEERVIHIQACGSTAEVSVQGGYHTSAGGLIGNLTYVGEDITMTDEALGVVENCWSAAKVTASGADFQSDCGGIVGHLEAGTIRGSWAKPAVSVADDRYAFINVGGIAGAVYEKGIISDCWANASGCAVPGDGGHYGGITGRMKGSISNCFALGTSKFASENAISYDSWTEGPVTACMDMTNAAQAQKSSFYQTSGWDYETVWDKSGALPILRGCDAAAQRAAQS